MKKNRKYIFKNNILDFRVLCGFTQQQLADRCFVSRNTISLLENGTFSPSAYLSGILCHVLECKWEDLFYYEEIK